MWDLLVSVPDHCLSFYFESTAYLLPGDYRVTDEALLAETT